MKCTRKIDLFLPPGLICLFSKPSSQARFLFSRTYLPIPSVAVYFGEKSFVYCADTRKRFCECSNLKICVTESTTSNSAIEEYFPPSFLLTAPTVSTALKKFTQGLCNVIASDFLLILSIPELADGEFVFGSTVLISTERAIVTRNDDLQWHDIINSVLEGQMQGVKQDESRCQISSSNPLNMTFSNAPTCIGSLPQIFGRHFSLSILQNSSFLQSVNKTKRALPGMVRAPSFGVLTQGCPIGTCDDALKSGTLQMISKRKRLNCAFINYPENKGLTAMSELYCRAVAVAIFQGDSDAVNATRIDSFNDSMIEFLDGEFDLIAGESRGLRSLSPDMSGESFVDSGRFHFSTPYYYTSLDE